MTSIRKNFDNILDDICKEKNIKLEEYSFGWIKKLIYGDNVKYILGETFELNSNVSASIASDKYATYEVLKNANIPIMEHRMVFNPLSRKKYYKKELLSYAEKLLEDNDQIVIKANNSCEGKDVYKTSNLSDVEKIVEKIFNENNDSISICPFKNIDFEYRNFYLDGEILYTYRKEKPFVIGDGISTIKELIENQEEKYNINIECDENLNLEYIPNLNEKITVSWKHNLSNGGVPEEVNEITDSNLIPVKELAITVGNAINARFVTVDIIHTMDGKISVLEINANVNMNHFVDMVDNGYNIAKNIYEKAIEKLL